jgi:hypothetical protein
VFEEVRELLKFTLVFVVKMIKPAEFETNTFLKKIEITAVSF